MPDEDLRVAMMRWRSAGGVALIAEMGDEVLAFARRHGMPRRASDDLRLAVSEAIAGAVARSRGGQVVVDAATDGEWLSIRVAHDHDPTPGDHDLPLVMTLPQRVERSVHEGRAHLLMEFEMGTEAPSAEGAHGAPAVERLRGDAGRAGRPRHRR